MGAVTVGQGKVFHLTRTTTFGILHNPSTMNWKLIFRLSLFGLAMAVATVYWIPSKIEPLFWLVIFLFVAWTIAKQCTGKYFMHGFMVSMVNAVWIMAAHILLAKTYLANHPEEAKMFTGTALAVHPRLSMLIVGPIAGAVFGVILGLFCWVASRIVKKK